MKAHPWASVGTGSLSQAPAPARMPPRELGGSGIKVSPIGLGCWQFSQRQGLLGKFWNNVDSATVRDIVNAALKAGIDWFDTAEIYGQGRSEQVLAAALKALGKNPGEVFIATKWWPLLRFARDIPISIVERQAALNGFPIGLYQIHQPWSFSRVETEMDRMAELAAGGKIRLVGVSNFGVKAMVRAAGRLKRHGLRLASNQVKFNLLDRRIETNGILDQARAQGVSLIAWSPLEMGLLTGKFHRDPGILKTGGGPRRFMAQFREKGLRRSRPVIEALQAIASRHRATPAQVALHWVVRIHGPVVLAVPGATTPLHVECNAGAMDLNLDADEMERLNEVSAPFRTRPLMERGH